MSTILSAQCTDKRVNKITPHLFKRANYPYDMIKLSINEIEDIMFLKEQSFEKYSDEIG